MRKLGAVILAVILLRGSMLAQTPRLRGTVLDPSGAVIPDAVVKVFKGDAVVKQTKTGNNGVFAFEIAPGEYRLEVIAADFNPNRQNVRVLPDMAPLAIRMVLAAVSMNVDVSAVAKQGVSVDSDAGLTTSTLIGDSIKALPDDDDQLLAQLQLIADASGIAEGTAILVVDGIIGGRIPPRDQIQQIIIESSSFSADSSGGPRIQIITHPGTGPWSGGANFGIQNEAFNAKNPFDTNKPAKRRHTFQTNYGGPVIPGRLSLRLNARSVETAFEGNSVLAVTPNGPVNKGVFSPTINRYLGLDGQLYFTESNILNFSGNYNSNASKNQGIGGVTLPERATNLKGHNWNLQFSERAILSSKITSEIRFYMSHNQDSQLPVTEAVAINVLDAFNGGGAQNRTRRRSTNYSFGNTIHWMARRAVNLQIGSDFVLNRNYSSSETNYLGLFVFSSLDDYLAGRPVTFRRTTGDPIVNVHQLEGATFIQADWRLNPKLNVGAGARYQAQTNLRDYNNIAPTFQTAYTPRKGTVLRAGGRLAYQAFFIGNVETLKRQDGSGHQVETVISNPSYPDAFLNGDGATAVTNRGSIRTRASNLAAPHIFNSGYVLEQELFKGWKLSASFETSRRVHLIRTRNTNAPYPGSPLAPELLGRLNSTVPSVQAAAKDELDRMRPFYPFVGNIYQFESAGNAFSKNMNLRFFLPSSLKLYKLGLTGFAQYTLGWTDDNASAANQYDWKSEWARASNDARHRMQGNFNATLPWATSMSFLVFANSGRPYSITTGRDENGDQSTTDRPAGVRRNSATGPGSYNVNMQFTKVIPLKKTEHAHQGDNGNEQGGNKPAPAAGAPRSPASGPRLNFLVQVNNLLNNTQLRQYSGVLTSPLFGKPTGTMAGRTMTLGLSMNW